ncbi:MAG: DNA-binding protein [Alphaproteobacteria bacterium TMED89]|nr:MAG: DNA-binding protein [Alphaproteobacteria bacterium TMED89]
MTSFLTPLQAANILHVSTSTLNRWRRLGTGPRFCKLPGRVRYMPSDVYQFMLDRGVSTTAQARGLRDRLTA